MTVLATVLIAAVALVVGVAVGVAVGRRRVPPPDGGVVAPPAPPPVADLLQRAFRAAEVGMAVLDRTGEVVLHNAQAAELGVVRDGQADARAAAAFQTMLQTGELVTVDLSPLRGRARPRAAVLANVRPLVDGYGLVEATDTSEAVRLEATRRDFVANVSHELKTPVGAMGVLAEAVLDAADDADEVRRFGTKIVNESRRLGNLVTELIALSRLTGAERLPEMCAVGLDDVVDAALARSKVTAESARIDIVVDRPLGIEVDGDETLLVTALSNLVENAIAYSPPDAVVSVSRRRSGHWAEISVTDRGIGIAPEHQVRVFERFFRVDPARSRATGGTGLGLAIVKHVLANHGGEVGLWSSPGTGSTFTMRLPVRAADRRPLPVPEAAAPGESRPEAASPPPPDPTDATRRPADLPDRVG
ncbi:sensor histidine kinase [Pseudonocardia lacus]|uniref:sensor histidine kinase n=1 Tax=Pseudonocardia lacus TaxID=2835865 RepID=UPI0027E342C5|nr:ATP-binding protein [Pseudonocardia lacus]